MGTVTFVGNVSAQAAPGETVTVTVQKPDTTTDTVTGVTDAQGMFTAAYNAAPGHYSATASVPADAVYQAVQSNTVQFDVQLSSRTITLSVS